MAEKGRYEYGVNDIPPPRRLLLLSIQHVLLMFMSLGLPIIFASQINASPEVTTSVISFSMLAAGTLRQGTALHSILLHRSAPHSHDNRSGHEPDS